MFRHHELPLFSVFSLPSGRLDALRSRGRPADFSVSRFNGWELLRTFGLGTSVPPSTGRPCVRAESGHVFRWGEGWFAEVRDGVGWQIPRKDETQTDFRVQILFKLWLYRRPQFPFMLQASSVLDAPALEDGLVAQLGSWDSDFL